MPSRMMSGNPESVAACRGIAMATAVAPNDATAATRKVKTSAVSDGKAIPLTIVVTPANRAATAALPSARPDMRASVLIPLLPPFRSTVRGA